MSKTTDTEVDLSEIEAVELWREHVLVKAGVKKSAAIEIARADTDLHKAVEAKLAGATDRQLVRIFGA